MNEDLKTWAHVAIFEADDNSAFGLGCELMDNVTGIYHIFSLYLPADEYPNRRQILLRKLPEIIAEVPDDHVAIKFCSSMPQFGNRRELIRKNQLYVQNVALDFKKIRSVRRSVISLAIDAVQRKTSITEKL